MDFNKADNPVILRDFSVTEIGNTIYSYSRIESTNSEAKRKHCLPHGTIFKSSIQTGGRGRLGRTWQSDGGGLYFSVLLKPSVSVEDISLLTLVFGMAVCDVIKGSFIKWPNDIVLNKKKVCGILTESSVDEAGDIYVVVGIGVNVNNTHFDESIKNTATSVSAETGVVYSETEILKKICIASQKYYDCFISDGFKALRDEYMSKCITIGREVVIKTADGEFTAIAEEIDETGELIVIKENERIRILSGEVSVRGIFGYI